ncbi:MAG: VWA domain-containing protein, partial [Proteobacteria bacterium]|nr:VWA domain-containing protein [Pseudomonadota bacterium]
MKLYSRLFSQFKALMILLAGLLILSTISVADESPNLADKLIKYKSASVQAVSGTPSGLWHTATQDGKSGVWYYGIDSTQTFNTGSSTSGTLDMTFDLTSVTSASLTLDTKYKTESSTYYDELQIMVGNNILWKRSTNESKNSSQVFGWESLSLPLTSYIGSQVTITFSFNSKDSVANSYFGWAIHNVQAGSGTSSGGSTGSTGGLVINQLDIGNFPNINAYVSVTDANGQSVSGLTKSGFKVFEDSAYVSNFTVTPLVSSNQALSLGLMIDQSGSMGSNMSTAVDAVKDFINLSTGVQDQFGLVSIGSYGSAAVNQVLTLQNFTTDKTALINGVDGLTASGMTPLYDGIAKALEMTVQQPGVKAVIAFTDGDDTYSKVYTVDSVIAYAQSLGIPVYTIAIGYIGSTSETILTKIANMTGGTYTEATSATDLSTIYAQLLSAINQQYLVSFQSLDPSLSVNSLPAVQSTANQICVKIEATLPSLTIVSAIACYDKLNMPPNVTLDTLTSSYLQNGPASGSDLTIGAIVTDQDLDAIGEVSLYYRVYGSNDTFDKLDMLDIGTTSTSTYTALVPGADFGSAGIEFYITASAGIHTKTVPSTGYYQIIPGASYTGSTGGGFAQQIYILSPTNNKTISYGSTSGQITFSWTKITNVAKYVLNLELNDVLNNMAIPIPFDLIPASSATSTNPWGTTGTTTATPGLSESLLGMVYAITLDQATWDVLALYDIKWGIEAYDSS